MKTIFTLLAATFLINLGHSQPVISNFTPNFGDKIIYNGTDTAWTTGDPSVNMNWDYSEQNIYMFDITYDVLNPADVEGSDQFPDAKMVWSADIGFAILNSYMSFEDNKFTDYGTLSVGGGTSGGRIYDDPEVHFTYPLAYQNTGSDTFNGNILSGFSEGSMTGESSYLVDAYGSISTPYGTYDNVLRITTTKVESFSSFETNTTETSWYSSEYPVPVFIITRSIDTFFGFPEDEQLSTTVLVMYIPASTGITESTGEKLFEIYPNPATDNITISSDFEGRAELRIYSVEGKMVTQKSVQSGDNIDLNDLQPGYYIAQLTINNQPYASGAFVINE